MDCAKCQTPCREHQVGYYTVFYCVNCWDFILDSYRACQNHDPEFVRYEQTNGIFVLRKQCKSCWQIDAKCYKKDSVKHFDMLPLADKAKANSYYDLYYEKIQEIRKRYFDKKREKSRNEFLEEHNEYMDSEEWKKRRQLVLQRDHYTCQSCLKNRATQVHHLSYKHWHNEPLFELIAVCDECHKIITEMDRESTYSKNIIK